MPADNRVARSAEVFRRICPICEAKCGVLVTVASDTGAIASVRGDPDDPASRGYICPKGVAVRDLQNDPDVVRRPLIKRNGRFEEVSWEEAIAYSVSRLNDLRERYGDDAVGAFMGNAFANNPGMTLYVGMFAQSLGSKQIYSSTSVDHLSRLVSNLFIYGSGALLPVPDIDRTMFFVAHGANPVVSNGSFMTAPGVADRLKELRKRGGKLVVIDPRRTETAEIADLHIPIRPGTDAQFLLACVNHLFASGQVRLGRLADFCKGLDEVEALARDFTPDSVAEICGVSAAVIRELVDEFAKADGAVWYGRTGTCTQHFGTISCWLQELMNILTGNLDREGGVMFPAGAIPAIAYAESLQAGVVPFGRWHSRVSHLPELGGMLPSAALPDEILVPGEGQLRGFITMGANPVLSTPNGPKLAKALESLEFMLALDVYINETTQHADVILPNASQYTESSFYLMHIAFMVRSWAKWTPPVLPNNTGQLAGWEIMRALSAGLVGKSENAIEEEYVEASLRRFLDDGDNPLNAQVDFAHARNAIGQVPGPDRLYDIMLRTGRLGDAFGLNPAGLSVARLAEHPEGLDFGPMEPHLPEMLKTPDGKIDLVPDVVVSDMPRLRATMEDDIGDGLLLIGRRHARSKNSWMHNLDILARGKDRCTLMIHPRDAASREIANGDLVAVSTELGSVQIAAEVTEGIMPGVVSVPHGWGHDEHGTRMGVAKKRPGVNINAIISETEYDAASVISAVNGIRVRVEKSSPEVK